MGCLRYPYPRVYDIFHEAIHSEEETSYHGIATNNPIYEEKISHRWELLGALCALLRILKLVYLMVSYSLRWICLVMRSQIYRICIAACNLLLILEHGWRFVSRIGQFRSTPRTIGGNRCGRDHFRSDGTNSMQMGFLESMVRERSGIGESPNEESEASGTLGTVWRLVVIITQLRTHSVLYYGVFAK